MASPVNASEHRSSADDSIPYESQKGTKNGHNVASTLTKENRLDHGLKDSTTASFQWRWPADNTPWKPAFAGALSTLLVALIGITSPSIWFDEAATISGADRGLRSYAELMTTIDAVHGLYYLMMMPWVEIFGSSALSIRIPSALILAASAFITSKLAMGYVRQVAPESTVAAGFVAGALFAVLPGLAWMGHDARGYPFGVFCVLVAWWAYEKWLRSEHDHWLFVLIVSQSLGVYFSLYTAMIVPLFLVRAAAYGWRPLAKFGVAAATIGAGMLPLLIGAVAQQGQISWISSTVPKVAQRMASNQFFIGQRDPDAPWFGILQVSAWLLFGVTTLLCAYALLRGPLRRIQTWLFSIVLFPIGLLLAIQAAGGQFYDERYLVFTAPALVILVALATTVTFPGRLVGLGVVSVIIAMCLPAVIAQHHGTSKFGSDYRRASALLERADTVYFVDAAARGVTMAYPLQTPAIDPLLASSAVESGTLWGLNLPLDRALEEQPTGSVAVATIKGTPHAPLVDHFVATGCVTEDEIIGGRTPTTLLDCPTR